MTDDRVARGLTLRQNIFSEDIDEGAEVDVRSVQNGLLSYRPMMINDLRRSLDASGVRSGDVAEVWVSPDGDDDNPGTRDAPFATITKATEYVQETYASSDIPKTVRVMPGTYTSESILINHRNVRIIGAGPRRFSQLVEVSTDGRDAPILSVTNMTKEAWEDYQADGGPSYSEAGDEFEYTGAQINGRDVRFGSVQMDVVIENLLFRQSTSDADHKPPIQVIGAPAEGGDSISLNTVIFRNVGAYQILNDDVAAIYAKHAALVLAHCAIVQTLVLDNARKAVISDTGSHSEASLIFNVIGRHGGEDTPLEGTTTGGEFFSGLSNSAISSLRVYDSGTNQELHTGQYNAEFPHLGEVILRGDIKALARRFNCTSLTRVGVQMMNIGHLQCEGDVFIDGGASNRVDGGVIGGDLTVSGGSDVIFTGVRVMGNVDLTDAGDVTWRGGSYYGTLTDPSAKLGGASSGDYLNVEA